MKKLVKKNIKSIQVGFIVLFIFLVASSTNAQGLTISDSSSPMITADTQTLIFVVVRMLLSISMIISAIYAFIKGYQWMTHEGNLEKYKVNKDAFANAVLLITIIFILMALFRFFVPNYATLQI